MFGTVNRREDGNGGLRSATTSSEYYYGERATCELCEVEQQCFDRHGLVTCQSCQTEFLPSGGGVLYFG